MLDEGHVLRTAVGSQPRQVVVEDDIEAPGLKYFFDMLAAAPPPPYQQSWRQMNGWPNKGGRRAVQDGNSHANLKRREVVRSGLGTIGVLSFISCPAYAAGKQRTPIGTWPAGVAADSVFVGVTVPLTGPYSADGKDEALGYKFAFAEINDGSPIAQKWGLKGKGVLGKQIRFEIADTETKPNLAVQAQTRFITINKAMMITGSTASSTAVALEELAQREKVLNMVGGSGSNATTGKDCQRYGFRSQPSAYMVSQALVPVLVKAMGKNLRVAYLTPDYTYGHSLFNSISAGGKKYGWTVVSNQVVPLGTTDFSAALLNIANSDANLFVNIAFGADAVASTEQAAQFGVLKKMKMAAPNLSDFQAKETSKGLMAGVYGTTDFWWTLGERYPLAKDFVQAFFDKNKYYPREDSHIAYMQTYLWALAVERAGTFYPPAVIKALEASKANPFDSTLGKVWYRAEDHQLVRPVPVLLGKNPSEMKNPEDFYRVIGVVPGEQLMPPLVMSGCHLGSYL